MRKRTQLVGFEFGYWKHVQYCAEFIDNALDAIESFQWKELAKTDSKIAFSLDQELFLEKFSILETAKEEKRSQQLDNGAKHTLMQEFGIESTASPTVVTQEIEVREEESGEIIDKEELEIEEEVKRVIDDMQEIIKPVEFIIDLEPIVIVRIREYEALSLLTSEISQKNIMSYIFEIFDNGTGMSKIDLKKFGRYLASSKSMELKQTRGSQGFGAPSAFSDAQNTTGKPVVTVSKSKDQVYAICSEFFTTSKNEKKYLIHPTEIDSPFLHGTYIKLNYLNVKYIKGYVEKYIQETAFMNPHVTIIYIDPEGKEKIYRRLATSFPPEPKYAKPHPSSINIGDLQDLITKSENKSISAFLQDNFVRMSSKIAKEIVDLAERDLQDKLNLLILKDGYINVVKKKSDQIYFMRNEKRVYGRSTKPRDKLIIYQVDSEDLKEKYGDLISSYNKFIKEYEKVNKEITKLNNRIEKTETKKEIRAIEREIKTLLSKIDDIRNKKDKIKSNLNILFKDIKDGLVEQKKFKDRTDFEVLVAEVELSKIKPVDITKEQFNSLFLAFKSIKYMAPPTDTAIPVGESILENTLIKEIGLRISDNIDNYDTPIESISKIKTPNNDLDSEELVNLNSEILGTIELVDETHDYQQMKSTIEDFLKFSEADSIETYREVFDYFLETFTKDDDFVAAETRAPTSGKGLAYVVEAVMAYSRSIEIPKRSRDVLSRFVNRTPKLRDNADCAITKAVQSVNWKNYNLETYDNGLPRGPIKLLVNVSGPFVHLMFKSQSKNALADDEELIKEIKYCLEAIGRRLRVYINRRAKIHKSEKRASLIEKYIPTFIKSVYNIASQGESKFKARLDVNELEELMKGAIGKKPAKVITEDLTPEKTEVKEVIISKEEPTKIEVPEEKISVKKEIPIEKPKLKKEVISKKTLLNWTVKELKDYCEEHNIVVQSKERKNDIIEKILQSFIAKKPEITEPIISEVIIKKPKPVETSFKKITTPKPTQITPPIQKSTQTTLPIITTDKIISVLSNEWQSIKHLIFKLKIKDMMDARYLQLKLKELERKGEVLVDIKMGRKHWKLK